MAQTGFITYDETTGEPVGWGRCEEYDVVLQGDREAGRAAVAIPADTVIITDVEMASVRSAFEALLDQRAAAILAPGMNPIYPRKLAEARAGRGAMIEAEARALGIPVAELAKTIIARAAQQDALEVRVETARRAAKKALRDAPNIGRAHQALISVDWDAIIKGE